MADDAEAAAHVLRGLADALSGEISEDVLLEVGHFATTMILARTKTGQDAGLAPFKPYAKGYAAWRGRRGLRPDPPDLAVKGHMLGALHPVVTGPDEVTLMFSSRREADKALWANEGTKRAPQREFLDVRDSAELQALADVVGEGVLRDIEKRR